MVRGTASRTEPTGCVVMIYRYVYVVVQGQQINSHWIETPIFNDAWMDRQMAEDHRQQAIDNGVGGALDITIKSMRLIEAR